MSEITPITREEKLWNGEDLEPLTREEMYIKRIFDKTQTIPDKPLTRKEILMEKAGEGGGGDVTIKQLSVTANGTYSEEGTAYSPVNVAVPLPENAYLLKEASGSLVSFDDGADLPMPSFICNIDAQQDLHGYDAPWVGGAGKNKYPIAIGRDSFGDNVSATHTTNNDVLTISCMSVNDSGVYSTPLSSLYEVSTKLTGTYTWSVDIKCDKNATIAVGYQQVGRLYVSATTQWQRVSYTAEYSGSAATFTIYSKSGEEISIQIKNLMIQEGSVATSFEPYSNICPILGHTGVDAVISPTTEASAGTTIAVSWQSEAGEVFGGYVDLVSGELTATHKSQTGFTRGSQDSSNKLYKIGTFFDMTSFSGGGIPPYFIDNMFEKMSLADAMAAETPCITQYLRILYVGGYIGKEAELDTLLETLQVKYELETPLTYQLTPTQIKSLLGNNNAWCSTGDVDIDYFAKEVTG